MRNRNPLFNISRQGAAVLWFLGVLVIPHTTWSAAPGTAPALRELPPFQTPIADPGTERADYNLGATGMRGWIFGNETYSDTSREILVRVVEKGSPAEGVFQKFDLITGVNGKPFQSDARETFAAALTAAEKTGALHLLRMRDGNESNVTLKLEVLGEYSTTAPFDCPKSQTIVANTTTYIATRLLPEKEEGMGVPRAMNALLLLSTGKPEYLPQVRRYARHMAEEMEAITDWNEAIRLWTWHYGYKNLLLTEYYLATGDRSVLPAIENICSILARGQGLPGAWCHSLSPKGHIMPGYGAVNNTGLVCFMSMALGKECGVDVDNQALADSFSFFGSFAGKGTIPYGDHSPGQDNTANGKSGLAATAFTIMDAPATAEWFSKLAASANSHNLYRGHTGNFWNHTWTPIGAHHAGKESFIAFFKRVHSNYDLMRRWDHGFVTNPDYSARECFGARRKYGGPYWGPGAFTLFLTAPQKRLQILGAPRSIFAKNACPPQLKNPLALYQTLNYQACLDSLKEVKLSGEAERMHRQLKQAAEDALAANHAGLAAALANQKKGDLYLASVHLNALQGILSANDPDYKSCKADLATNKAQAMIETGRKYYQLAYTYAEDHIRFLDEYRLSPKACISPNHRAELKTIADSKKTGIYRDMAAMHLKANPLHPYQRLRHEWLPTSEYSPLTPIFNSGVATAKNVPNVDVETPLFSPTPGERQPPLNEDVLVEYVLFDSSETDEHWTPGTLPIGELDIRSKDKSRALTPGRSLRARLTFMIDDPERSTQWFVTCKAGGLTDIQLNGTRIAQLAGIDRKYRIIHLKQASAAFFVPGKNILTVEVATNGATSSTFLDIGLDALAR